MLKKGIAFNSLVQMILVIVALIILSSLISWIFLIGSEKTPENACRASVEARAATAVAGGDVNILPLACSTVERDLAGDRENIKADLAYNMARCWYQFAESRFTDDLDDAGSIADLLDLEFSDNKCFVCYTMPVREDEIDGGDILPTEMTNYLIRNDYEKVGLKYIDYFQEYGGKGTAVVASPIEPREVYAVTYLARNGDGDDGPSVWDTLFGAVVPDAIEVANAVTTQSFYNIERPISMVVVDKLKNIRQSGCIINEE